MSYGIIYADPPWYYARDMDKVLNKTLGFPKGPSTMQPKYQTMQVEEIAALDNLS